MSPVPTLRGRRAVRAEIDRDLGRLYRALEVRAVPEHLKTLLDRLDPPPAVEPRRG